MLIGLAILISVAAYQFGYKEGFDIGHRGGYTKGQVDLALDLTREINEVVNKKTFNDHYKHFRDIDDISLYIYEKNGLKTIATWNSKTEDTQLNSN